MLGGTLMHTHVYTHTHTPMDARDCVLRKARDQAAMINWDKNGISNSSVMSNLSNRNKGFSVLG